MTCQTSPEHKVSGEVIMDETDFDKDLTYDQIKILLNMVIQYQQGLDWQVTQFNKPNAKHKALLGLWKDGTTDFVRYSSKKWLSLQGTPLTEPWKWKNLIAQTPELPEKSVETQDSAAEAKG
jgi:hypothetical protein